MTDISQTGKKSNFFAVFAYFFVAVFGLFIFRNASINKLWFDKVDSYWDAYKLQSESNATPEQRMQERLGAAYMISQICKNYFAQNNIKNPVILFEPNAYLEANGLTKVWEPIIFYNYSGLKSVWMNSSNVADATHIAYISHEGLRIEPIHSKEELNTILEKYKNYKPAL